MAQESGIETPTAEDLARFDRKRKGKTLSNAARRCAGAASWSSAPSPISSIAAACAAPGCADGEPPQALPDPCRRVQSRRPEARPLRSRNAEGGRRNPTRPDHRSQNRSGAGLRPDRHRRRRTRRNRHRRRRPDAKLKNRDYVNGLLRTVAAGTVPLKSGRLQDERRRKDRPPAHHWIQRAIWPRKQSRTSRTIFRPHSPAQTARSPRVSSPTSTGSVSASCLRTTARSRSRI